MTYQWRGSDVDNILTFRRRYRKVEQKPISVNRRSRPGIIKAANGFSSTIKPRLEKAMKAYRRGDGTEVCCWLAETPEHEARVIGDTVERLRKAGFAYKDVAVLLRSVRTSAVPFLDEFRRRSIPFRCAGRTGLLLQDDAQLFGKTYAWLAGATWRESPYSQPEPISQADLVREYASQFSVDASGKRALARYLNKWAEEVTNPTQAASLVRDYYALLRLLGVQQWNLDDPLYAARMGSLARFSQLLVDFESVTRRARPVPEEGNRIRGGQDRGAWFYQRLYWYIQYYALGAYEGFEGEETFDYDAVEVLTVHQAKGLEWPIVFVPALKQGRFPSRNTGAARDWLVPEKLVDRSRYEGAEVDERRLFYVAMTRARDFLYLSTFRRMQNRATPSPFLMEVAGGTLDTPDALPLPDAPDRSSDKEPVPTIPFSEVASYIKCPFAYRLESLLGFQPPLAQELGYGKSVHHILRRVAEETARTGRIPDESSIEALFLDEFYLPYANQPGFERMVLAARKLVSRYVARNSDDLHRVWEIERPFELHLPEATITGRADVILDREGGSVGSMAILDYKTSVDRLSDELHAIQLAVYAAAGRGEGLNVRAAYVHDLSRGERIEVPTEARDVEVARQKASAVAQAIRQRRFHYRKGRHCQGCDVRHLCRNCPKHESRRPA